MAYDPSSENSRRKFIGNVAKGVVASAILPGVSASAAKNNTIELRKDQFGANDQLQIALIGAGGMGNADADTAITIPGIKLIAACDLYDGRLEQARKKYGPNIFTTRDYKEILNRKDIDAVIIATPDHWHKDIAVDALNSGKSVYIEKPMVQSISEGPALVEAQKKTNKVLQVGSQGMSSLGNEKAKELYESGAIGQLNYVEGFWARNTPGGAWQYDIPADASAQNVDWKKFLKDKLNLPFDPKRFFRWRCFRDYGTGVGGDLFVLLAPLAKVPGLLAYYETGLFRAEDDYRGPDQQFQRAFQGYGYRWFTLLERWTGCTRHFAGDVRLFPNRKTPGI